MSEEQQVIFRSISQSSSRREMLEMLILYFHSLPLRIELYALCSVVPLLPQWRFLSTPNPHVSHFDMRANV